MLPRRARRASAPLLLACSLLLLAACGGDGDRVVAGSGEATASTVPGDPPAPTEASAPTTTTTTTAPTGATPATDPPPTAVPAPTSTTIVAPVPDGGDASPVAGLTAAELAAAVAAPGSSSLRRTGGPVAEPIAVDGTTAWRVRVPSDAPIRSARVEVLVGGRSIGSGVPTAEVDAIVAVTLDPAGLVAGAPVALRWEGGDPIAAGALVVAR